MTSSASTCDCHAESNRRKLKLFLDIESDGQSPAMNSIREIGIYAVDAATRERVGEFNVCIKSDEKKHPEQRCLDWWKTQEGMTERIDSASVPGWKAFTQLDEFLQSLGNAEFSFVGYPASFDWMWFKTFVENFGGKLIYANPAFNPPRMAAYFRVGYSCECLDERMNVYCALTGVSWSDLEKELLGGETFPHRALDDAKLHAKIYFGLEDKFKPIACLWKAAKEAFAKPL